MSGQSIFISGGNRGIGFQLVKQFAADPANTVFATTRSIEKSPELTELAKVSKNIKILVVDVSSQESIDALAKELPKDITEGLDVFISNAAIGDSFYTILDAPREVYQSHYNVNVLGAISLTKILHPYLLKKSTRKIVFNSSVVGQINEFVPVSCSAYGQSKAAINYTAKALSFELDAENFTVIPIHPGAVSTDMGNEAVKQGPPEFKVFFDQVSITPVASAEAIIKVVDSLTRESNGKFYSYDGTQLSY